LPLDRNVITDQSGFGPNWYATYYADCLQNCYDQSHNIHTGLDFFAPAGSTAYATVSGTIVAIYATDGKPNVVIAVTVGEITYYVVHGHVTIDAALKARIDEAQEQDKTVQVNAGDIIGTIAKGENHVHLGLRRKTIAGEWAYNGQDRAYNPRLFMDSDLTVGMDFVSNEYPYYGNESPTSIRSFLYGAGSYYEEENRNSMGMIR
jgi:murein DD-endopeptidase MepM/ murein hydrolase activator NlpD